MKIQGNDPAKIASTIADVFDPSGKVIVLSGIFDDQMMPYHIGKIFEGLPPEKKPSAVVLLRPGESMRALGAEELRAAGLVDLHVDHCPRCEKELPRMPMFCGECPMPVVPFAQWPFGAPSRHESNCALFVGGPACDCELSRA